MPVIDIHKSWNDEFGTLTKMSGFLRTPDVILAFDPDDIEKVYRTEGVWPIRKRIETFVHYRTKVRPEVYAENGGLLNEDGAPWHHIRTRVNPTMLQPRTVKKYVSPVEEVADDFILRILKLRDRNMEMPADFFNELNRWALESIGRIALDARLGCLVDNLAPDSEPQKMIHSAHTFFTLGFDLEIMPSMWRYYPTKPYKQLMAAFDVMTFTSMKYVDAAEERSKTRTSKESDDELSILEKLLKIDRQVAIVMAMDMLLAGIDTTASATACLIYHLATNALAQDKLRRELLTILPEKGSKLTEESFNSAPYLRACMKESHRLMPVVSGVMRTTVQDIVLSGYQIPKGTDVVMGHLILSRSESQFPRSKEFIPERWLGTLTDSASETQCPHAKTAHPFAYMPFGFGPRVCIGKRFAELEMQTLITKLFRNHRIQWNYGEYEIESKLLNTPKTALKFQISDVV